MERLLPLAFLLVTALLSGCAGTDGPSSADAAEPADTISEPIGGSPEDGPAAAAGPTEPAVGTCSVTVIVGSGVQGNLQNAYNTCRFREADDDVGDYGWALVEATFPDAQPTETRFYLYLLSDSCDFSSGLEPCWHATESSPTPSLRLEAGAELLREFGHDGLRAYASLDGVAVQQDIVLAVTLVPAGQALPDGYTALV